MVWSFENKFLITMNLSNKFYEQNTNVGRLSHDNLLSQRIW